MTRPTDKKKRNRCILLLSRIKKDLRKKKNIGQIHANQAPNSHQTFAEIC